MPKDVFGIVGSVIANAYQVENVVAEGGFAVVYRAHHGGFRAPVALKCLKLPGELGDAQHSEFLGHFRAEAELLFRLSATSPHVVRPLHVDAFTTKDGRFVPYMVLEWLEGDTLDAEILRRHDIGLPPMTPREAIELLTPVARALERAHNFAGPDGPMAIVHRDLKPENIFLAKVAGDSLVKILDFGVAKAKSMIGVVAGRASQDGGVMLFTPAYAAPEQWAPKRFGQTGPWTDVWGLALTLVEVLTGRQVLVGDPASVMGTALDPIRRPTPGNEGVRIGSALEAVFARALAVDPRERPRDAGAFWNELLAALDEPAPRSRAADAAMSSSRQAVPHSASRALPAVGPAASSLRRPVPVSALASKTHGGFSVTELLRPEPDAPFARKILPGAVVAGASIVLTLIDQAYSAVTGELLVLGPLRASWLGGALLIVGLGLLVYRLLPRDE